MKREEYYIAGQDAYDNQPRDETTGRFAKGQQITPEHRAKMQAAKAAKHGLAQDLLESIGLDWDTAPPELEILAKKAASGDNAAMRLWLTQTKQLERPSKASTVAGGEVYNIVLSQESFKYALEQGVEFTLCPRCDAKGLLFDCPHCGKQIG